MTLLQNYFLLLIIEFNVTQSVRNVFLNPCIAWLLWVIWQMLARSLHCKIFHIAMQLPHHISYMLKCHTACSDAQFWFRIRNRFWNYSINEEKLEIQNCIGIKFLIKARIEIGISCCPESDITDTVRLLTWRSSTAHGNERSSADSLSGKGVHK